jgi:hypothetical protein
MTNLRVSFRGFVALLGFLALGAAGCGEADDPSGSEGAIVVAKPPGGPAPVTYEAMCRHYCETLETTVVLSCLASGGSAADCAARFPAWADRCEELRCAPRLVEPSLCLVQCDALANQYATYCGQASADAARCAQPAASQAQACRAGCGP